MYPILLRIPSLFTLPDGIIIVECVIGVVCLLAWIALRARRSEGTAVSVLSTVAILVVLHLILSWFMGKGQPIKIYTFGVVIILAFLAGVWFMTRQTRKLGLPAAKIFDWGFWLLLTGIIGSRLLFAFLNYDQFREDKLLIFKIWHGGLVWYGGLIPAAILAVPLLRKYKLPVLTTCDVCAVALMLGLGIGRWACLLAGDDYGARTDAWFGIRFTHPDSLVPAALRGELLHPTQLYMSVNALWLFFLLEWVRRRAKFAGTTFGAMLVLYALTRAAFIEPVRGDFVERNPGYGKHAAAEVTAERPEPGPAITLERGTAVRGPDGTAGRLLEDLVVPDGRTRGSAWAISDGPAKKGARSPLLGGFAGPEWRVATVHGAPGLKITSFGARWYGSDLPKPPNYVSTSQYISLGIVLAGVGLIFLARRLREPGFEEAVRQAEEEGDAEEEAPGE